MDHMQSGLLTTIVLLLIFLSVSGQPLVVLADIVSPSPQTEKVTTVAEVPEIQVNASTSLPYEPNRLIVKYKEDIAPVRVMSMIETSLNVHAGATVLKEGDNKEMPEDMQLLKLPNDTPVEDAVDYYEQNPAVEYAEPDYIITCAGDTISASGSITPNDTYWGNQYGMRTISAPGAWSITTGSSDVVVAVIDTGVNDNHEDLSANMWTDSSGYHGYDFVNNDYYPVDDNGHGTHCAGVVSAVGNNGKGVAGVSWNTRIMALKTMRSDGSGNTSMAISAIQYAKNNGVDILSCSWGSSSYSQSLHDAINSTSALIVCAAGNNATGGNDMDNTAYKIYPACYPNSNIISIANTDSGDNLWYTSNYGASSVDVAAPGVSITSTYYSSNTAYANMTGTSMSTPHVAGLAALMKSLHPSYTADEVKSAIMNNADIVSGLSGKCVTGGRINASATLRAGLETKFHGVPGTDVFPLTIQFYDDSPYEPSSWLWDFGDSNTSTDQNPTHVYYAPGEYQVNFTAGW